MDDARKTKAQLLQELAQLRHQVTALESAEEAHQRAEKALRENNQALQTLIQAAPLAILVLDRQRKILVWNPAAERLFGWSAHELVGQRLPDVPEELRDEFQRWQNLLQGVGFTGVEKPLAKKDGSMIAIRLSGAPLRDDQDEVHGVMVMMEDIAARQQEEQTLREARDALERQVAERTAELQAANKELQRSNAELEQFAYVASHDLREPLRKIQTFSDRLQTMNRVPLDEQTRDYLGRMHKMARRMQALIDDLLTFSRVTTRAQPFARVDLNQVVREVLSDLEVTIDRTQGRVEVGELPTIEADPTQMHQLFQNLISNALKFHRPEVPPLVRVQGKILKRSERIFANGEVCQFSVEDNGI